MKIKAKNRILCEDIINVEKPKMPTLSPSGRKVAYVVEKSNIENNCVKDSVYIYDHLTNTSLPIITMDKVSLIIWNGNVCYLLGNNENAYNLIRIKDQSVEVLLSTDQQLSNFAVSADDHLIYFSRLTKTSADIVKKYKESGYVYRWNDDNGGTILFNQYQHHEFEEIWCLAVKTNEQTFLTKFAWNDWVEWVPDLKPLIETMSLSTNGSFLAVCLNRIGKPELGEAYFKTDLMVINIKDNDTYKLLDNHLSAKKTPCWISDDELVFQESNYNHIEGEYNLLIWNGMTNQCRPITFFAADSIIKSITWNSATQQLYVQSTKSLYQLSMNNHQVSTIQLPAKFFNSAWLEQSFTLDHAAKWLATIIEDREQPPQVALYDISNSNTIVISALNTNIDNLLLGKIEPLFFEIEKENKMTVSTQGYLIHPVNEVQGKRYPLIVATYGFRGKTHAANAEEWHSSFPAQVFANEGYFVLLLNRPESYAQTNTIDSKQARDTEGWDMLRIFEHAVMTLIGRGCVDADKVGVYGWSHGAFIVEFLIAHSNKFKVACLGEGGDYNPGVWSAGNKTIISVYNNLFGGPPWGSGLKNYLAFSPYYHVDKIKSPVLMEFCGGGIGALEMYVPLRYQNVPAELVLYDGEPHNFVKPKARLASMKRKLDWFNFWFFDKRDLENPEQFERWVDMREKSKTRQA